MGIKTDKSKIPAGIKAAKDWWRNEIRKAMSDVDESYRAEASAKITAQLLKTDEYQSASVVMAYCSFGKEVDTHALIRTILADGKKVCLPRCLNYDPLASVASDEPDMESRYVTDPDGLSSGAYGIDEPPATGNFPVADPKDIDLVILPCLSCDTKCNRIGHGAGYYDKYLSKLSENTTRIALCYEHVLADELPVEDHDMPVDAVISEDAVYRWRP